MRGPPPPVIVQLPPGHPVYSIDVECVATGTQHNARAVAQVPPLPPTRSTSAPSFSLSRPRRIPPSSQPLPDPRSARHLFLSVHPPVHLSIHPSVAQVALVDEWQRPVFNVLIKQVRFI